MTKYLNKKQVMALTTFSDETIRRWEKDGKFPKRLRPSLSKTVWVEEEVLAWQQDQLDKR